MDYIKIEGYKSIKTLDFKVEPVNILIGANGAGKSNFISFFKMLNQLYEQNLQNYVATNGGINKFLYRGRKVTDCLTCELSFGNHNNTYKVELTAGEHAFVVTKEVLYYGDSPWNIAAGRNEAYIKQDNGFRASYLWDYLQTLKVYHFHDVGKNSPFNTDSSSSDYGMLTSDGSNLASVLNYLQQHEAMVYQRIVKVIQSVAPYFSGFSIRPTAPDSEYVRLGWHEQGNELLYGAADFSDGTMRFVALATLFLQPDLPKTIIIDEPEIGLHPLAIAKLAGLIKSASQRGCQVIVATQSADLVDCFEPNDVVVVDKKDGESVFCRLNNTELSVWLENYSLGELWIQNIINKGQPF